MCELVRVGGCVGAQTAWLYILLNIRERQVKCGEEWENHIIFKNIEPMIEEAEYLAAQLYPERERKANAGMNSSNGNQNFLREAFSSQAYYDEFCLLMSQLLQQTSNSFRLNSFPQKFPPIQSKTEERIGLDGKIKKETHQQSGNYQQPSRDIGVTIKLFEEAMRNKVSLQQRRQFLRNTICQQFSNSTKTYLDFKKHPTTKARMYSNLFQTPQEDIDLSLVSLQKYFSNKTKESKYDYILDMRLLKICFGHDDGENELEPGTSIFNMVFDKSSKLLFSADEQGLIKVWSKQTGLLLSSFRGHTSYIEQIYITEGNKYLVSNGPEGIRVWSLSKFECVASFMFQNAVFNSNSYYSQQTGLLIFISDSRYIYIIDENTISKANGKAVPLDSLIKKIEIVKHPELTVVQISINVNGYCLIGLENGEIILLDKEFLNTPSDYKYVKINEHSKKILQLSWNKLGTSFISGCTDGICRIWDFNSSCFMEGKLHSVAQLRMLRHDRKRKQKEIICNSVSWTCENNYIIACFSELNKPDEEEKLDGEIIVFDYKHKRILHEVRSKLFYRLECVNIMEPHPTIEEIALFCESNGRIVLFNILKCQLINVFHERCFHIDYPHLLIEPIEAKFSPDGNLIAVSTEYGNITLYGSSSRNMYFHCPTQQFFVTDKELFFPNDDMVPISASADIDINLLSKYPMCNVRNNPYDFQYSNDLQQLASNNFFSEELTALPISPNPYHTNEEWQEIIEKQTLENLSRQQALKSFYVSTEASGNQQLSSQQNFIINQYKEVLNSAITEFNSISTSISKPQIKTTETRKRLRKNKSKMRRNVDVDSDDKEDVSERESASYRQEENYEEEESEISYRSESEVYVNLRSRPKRRRVSDDDDDSVVENAKKPPAQRIQELDEIYDEIQERKNRRRPRQLESQEDVYVGNRRGSEPMPNQLCARCSKTITEQVEICSSCHTVYCKECKLLRGVDENYGYSCFNCLFLKKGSKDYEKNVLRRHFGDTKRLNEFYLPQVDDEVYFFYQGYEEVLIKYHDTLNPEASHIFEEFQLLAIDALEELKTAPLCRITDMEYLFPIKPRMRQNYNRRESVAQDKIKEVLIVIELLTEKGLTFQVFYVPGFVEFLVRKEVIDHVLNNQRQILRKLEENSIEILKNEEEVQIVKVKQVQGRNVVNFWRTVEVAANEEGTRRLRKDLHKSLINIWDIGSKIPKIPFVSMSESSSKKVIESIELLRISHGELFKLFEENVNLEEYPQYLKSVEVPICIETIVSRLKQGYYTSLKSVTFDLKLITKASASFSGAEHEVTLAAEELVTEICNVIDGGRIGNSIPPALPIHEVQHEEMRVEEVKQPAQHPLASDQGRSADLVPQNVRVPAGNRRSAAQPFPPRSQISQASSLSQQHQVEIQPELQRRSRPSRMNGGRHTRANPQAELTRGDRQSRSRRINYREMQVQYQSPSDENSHLPTRRSARHSLRQ